MLPKKALKRNLLAYWLCSKIHTLPFKFDIGSGSIDTSELNIWWLVWLLLAVCHCMFITGRLLQGLISGGSNLAIQQLPFHVICVCAANFNVYAGITAFIIWPKINMLLFNQLYNFKEENTSEESKKTPRGMQQMLIPLLPQMNYNCCLVFLTIYLTNPHDMQFIYSVLPPYMQNSLGLGLCASFEVAMCFYWMGVAHYSNFVQLSFFEKTMEIIEKRLEAWRNNASLPTHSSSDKIYNELRGLHLEISLFNLSNATTVFLWKCLNFIVPTFAIYFAIRFNGHPIMAGSNLFIGIYAFFMFIIMYDHAFAIPLGLQSLKDKGYEAINANGNRLPQKYYRQRLRSIPNFGIKVGSFDVLERTTTPKFVFFISNTVFSLLVLTR